jgi:hypothetical protein
MHVACLPRFRVAEPPIAGERSTRNLLVVHFLRDIQLDFSEELFLHKNVVFGILKVFPSMKQPLHRYPLRDAACRS